ncbi:SsrA-binding protein SmpB, partial [Streptomyces sp. NPDC054933]
MAKETGRKLIAQNKKARHDYHILDTYEAGLVLTGTEVKSLRQGRASLVDGFAQLDGGEAWLHNVHIPEYSQGTWTNHSARRKRKLLLHRAEIDKLIGKTQETGHTLVPLQLYFKDGRAKVEIALAKGKKDYDKRQTLREKQDRREADRARGGGGARPRGPPAGGRGGGGRRGPPDP